ncbi:MAG: PAC2 family protein [Sulfolobales archaeon]|nr:PAC2 family protein [Ignisphaera sp.]MCX8199746.1 PAC2 family protein [Sulfolobales archaeon]MDW8085017.1 PAC2 family protein [Ignisphaera sp.]
MWKIITHKNVDTEKSVAIVGFPGMGLVGKTVATHLINILDAQHIISIYSTKFPAHLLVNSNGLADIDKVSIYHAKNDGMSIFIITSDAQPTSDSDQHELSKFIAKKLVKHNVIELIATAAFVSEVVVPSRRVFVVGNNNSVIQKYIEKGATPLSEGVISGMNGIIIGWAKAYDINGTCILGETWRSIVEMNYVDYTASKIIIDLLNVVWGFNVDTEELEMRGRTIENEIENLLRQYTQRGTSKEEKEKRPYYIT